MVSPLGFLIFLSTSPVFVLLLHALANRLGQALRPPPPPQLVAILTVLGGYPVIGIVAWWIFLSHLPDGLERSLASLYALLVYGGLSYAYFHFFNMGETARRMRILYELKRNGRMRRSEIDARYPPRSMLALRLERLVAMRQLGREGDRYVLKGHVLYWIARFLTGWGRLLGLPSESRPS